MPQAPSLPDQIETPRLLLRPPAPTDAQAVCQAVTASLPELTPWMAWANEAYGMAQATAFCERAAAAGPLGEPPAEFALLITRKADGAVVGGSGYPSIAWQTPCFEIGYWLRTDCTGEGFATETARALTQCAFATLGACRVEIRMDARNTRSWAVPERLGFEWEATLKAHRRDTAGRLEDTRIYAMWDVASLR